MAAWYGLRWCLEGVNTADRHSLATCVDERKSVDGCVCATRIALTVPVNVAFGWLAKLLTLKK